MSTASVMQSSHLPPIKRLGFDDGWACFGPTFLNFGCPSIFVDACYLPAIDHLGFETFGARAARCPFPVVDVRVGVLGTDLSIYTRGLADPTAHHRFSAARCCPLAAASHLILLVGDSWELELSWGALWRSQIGLAQALDSPDRVTSLGVA